MGRGLQRGWWLLGILILAGCQGSGSDAPGPVVLLGVDGGSWNVIRELWDRGQLPHLRHLAERGVSAELQPMANASPVIWTSMATGVRPARHGIQGFEDEVDEAILQRFGNRIPEAYAHVDETLGELVARAPQDTTFFVLSDHGFQASKGERYRIQLHLDRVLERLGYLVRDGDRIDPVQSLARTWDSPPLTRTKLIRFRPFERSGEGDRPEDPESTRRRLGSDLGKVTYKDRFPPHEDPHLGRAGAA